MKQDLNDLYYHVKAINPGGLSPPGSVPPCGVVHVLFPSPRGLISSVRSLLDHLAARFGEVDEG